MQSWVGTLDEIVDAQHPSQKFEDDFKDFSTKTPLVFVKYGRVIIRQHQHIYQQTKIRWT